MRRRKQVNHDAFVKSFFETFENKFGLVRVIGDQTKTTANCFVCRLGEIVEEDVFSGFKRSLYVDLHVDIPIPGATEMNELNIENMRAKMHSIFFNDVMLMVDDIEKFAKKCNIRKLKLVKMENPKLQHIKRPRDEKNKTWLPPYVYGKIGLEFRYEFD